MPEDYQQLIYLLRRYKRSAASTPMQHLDSVPKLLVRHNSSSSNAFGASRSMMASPAPGSSMAVPFSPTSQLQPTPSTPSQGFVFPTDDRHHPSHAQQPPGWYPTAPHHSRQSTRPFSATLRSLPPGSGAGGRAGTGASSSMGLHRHHPPSPSGRKDLEVRAPFVLELPEPVGERNANQPLSAFGYVGDTYDLPPGIRRTRPPAYQQQQQSSSSGLDAPPPAVATPAPPPGPGPSSTSPGSPPLSNPGLLPWNQARAYHPPATAPATQPLTPSWSSGHLLVGSGVARMPTLALHSMTKTPAEQQRLEGGGARGGAWKGMLGGGWKGGWGGVG